MENALATALAHGTIRVGYATDGFESAVRGLLERPLLEHGVDAKRVDGIVESVLRREEAGSTSSGALALPHARVPGIPAIVAGLGVNRTGIHPDGETQVMVAFVSPSDAASEHLRFLSSAARTFRNAEFLQRVLAVRTGEELLALFSTGAESPSR